MNILQQQNSAKELSDQQLQQELLNPTGALPSYLALSELQRRKDMRSSYQSLQGKPGSSMAEEFARGLGGADVGKYGEAVRGAMPSSPGGEQPPMPMQPPMQAPMQPPMQPPMQDPMQQQFAAGGAIMAPGATKAVGAEMNTLGNNNNGSSPPLPRRDEKDILAGFKKEDGSFNPAALGPLAGIIAGQSVGDSFKGFANSMIGPLPRLFGFKGFADGGPVGSDNGGGMYATKATLAPSGTLSGPTTIEDILKGIGITNQKLGIAGASNMNPYQSVSYIDTFGGADSGGPGSGGASDSGTSSGNSAAADGAAADAGAAASSGDDGTGDGTGGGTGGTYYRGGRVGFRDGGGIPSWLYRAQRAMGMPTERSIRPTAITEQDVADAEATRERIGLENPNAILSNPYPLSRQSENRIPGPINPALGNQYNPYPEGTYIPPSEPRSSTFGRNIVDPLVKQWNKKPEPVFSEKDLLTMEQVGNRPSWFTQTTEAERAEIEAKNAVLEQKKKDLTASSAGIPAAGIDNTGRLEPALSNPNGDVDEGGFAPGKAPIPQGKGPVVPGAQPPPPSRRQISPPGGGIPDAGGPSGGDGRRGGGSPTGGIGTALNPDLDGFVGQVRGLQLPDRFGEIEARNQQEREDLKAGRESDKGLALLKAGMTMAGGTSSNALSNISAGVTSGISEWSAAEKEFRVANQAIRSAENAIQIARANRDERQLEMAVKVKMHFEEMREKAATRRDAAGAAAGARADAREDRALDRAENRVLKDTQLAISDVNSITSEIKTIQRSLDSLTLDEGTRKSLEAERNDRMAELKVARGRLGRLQGVRDEKSGVGAKLDATKPPGPVVGYYSRDKGFVPAS